MKFGRPLAAVLTVAALSGALTGTAMAASEPALDGTTPSTTIVISAGDGTLQGTYTLYQIGSYSDPVISNGKVSSVNVTGDAAQNAWAKTAIDAFNATSSHGINVDSGYDAVGTIARLNEKGYGSVDKTTASDQLSGVAQQLAAATNKPTAEKSATAADSTDGGKTVTVTVPEGLYLIVDSAGSPLIVGTTIGGKDMSNMTLSRATVKEDTLVTKQLSVDGTTYKDSVSASYGQTVKVKATQVVPNGTHPGGTSIWKLVDSPEGMTYKAGTLKLTVDGKTVTASKVYDTGGTTVKGDATLKDDKGNRIDPDITVPNGGWVIDVANLAADKDLAGKTLTIEYDAVVTKDGQKADGHTSDNTLNSHTVRGVNGTTGTPGNTHSPTPKVTYGGFTLSKTSLSDTTQSLSGAGFKIQRASDQKWLTYDSTANTWGVASNEANATMFLTGDTNHDGTVDSKDGTDKVGKLTVEGLAAGTYTVKETQAPTGYRNEAFSLPTFTATISEDGTTTTFAGQSLPNLTVDNKNNTVTVKDIQSLTQLPATGGAWTIGAYLAGAMLVAALAAGVAVRGVKRNRKADAE